MVGVHEILAGKVIICFETVNLVPSFERNILLRQL